MRLSAHAVLTSISRAKSASPNSSWRLTCNSTIHRIHSPGNRFVEYQDMKQAYEMAYRREKEMLGVVFDWRGA